MKRLFGYVKRIPSTTETPSQASVLTLPAHQQDLSATFVLWSLMQTIQSFSLARVRKMRSLPWKRRQLPWRNTSTRMWTVIFKKFHRYDLSYLEVQKRNVSLAWITWRTKKVCKETHSRCYWGLLQNINSSHQIST